MPKIIQINKICEEKDENEKEVLPEITSSKIFIKNRINKDGLFSEHIFGPVKNYTCQCGHFHGPYKKGTICSICGVPIEHSKERRLRFAKIQLPMEVLNPLVYDFVLQGCSPRIKELISIFLKMEDIVLYEHDNLFEIYNIKDVPKNGKYYEHLEAIKLIIMIEAEKNIYEEKDKNGFWKIVLDSIDSLITKYVLVLPPDLRPLLKSNKQTASDAINRYYMQMLKRKDALLNNMLDIKRDKNIFKTFYNGFQRDVNELNKHILDRLGKKKGLIRNNILGKRIDFSGRAVIVPEPRLNLDECIIPYRLFLEIFKLKVAKRLLHLGETKLLNNALTKIEKCIDTNHPELFQICEFMAENSYCILNRQPSLHRLSLLSFKIKIDMDNVIKIHPLVCHGFNADFDGDQMAIYVPITNSAIKEASEKLISTKNLINPANNSLITMPTQDIILGLYILTANISKDKNLENLVEYKGKLITYGQKLFNECLPEDYDLVDKIITKKELSELLNDIVEKYDEEVIKTTLDNLKYLGFQYSTLYGPTLSAQSFYLPEVKKIKEEIFSSDDIIDILHKTNDASLIDKLREGFKYSFMIDSGARGSWDQAKQMLFSRAFVSNFNGEILPTPVKHSLLEGMTSEELFVSTYGCRKGLLDVALNTGSSGYLSRKLIFCCINLLLDENLEDCKTTDYLNLFIDNDRKAEMLISRYHFSEEENKLVLITKENYKNIIGKEILLRSPILCKSKKICKTCYGELYKKLNTRFVGVVAAQALGETNTQLVLRTFHTSGAANIRGKENNNMKQEDIISDLSSASKILHNYNGTHKELMIELFNIYNMSKKLNMVHFEVIVSQLLWTEDENKWRLEENRNEIPYIIKSIQNVPSLESWLSGLGFSKPKQHILKGILKNNNYKNGIFDKILRGQKI